jgi:phosphoribosylamine--glycine ligase
MAQADMSRRLDVLLLGGGGREHALAWRMARSPLLGRLFVAPGNPGTATLGENIALDPADHPAVVSFCQERSIGLVVVGAEAPLVAGLADALRAACIPVFGHGREAARLEGSKAYMKALCDEAGIPTAGYRRFTDAAAARDYIRERGAPIVVKYDGLAAGKGVVVADTVEQAEGAVDSMFAGAFGAAGEVVIEEVLAGEEASFFALVSGREVLAFGSAQDHKRAFDNDMGPNTGGMGAYSPAPVVTPEIECAVLERIIRPAAETMAARGAPLSGVLFAGLMIGPGGPSLIEFNVRFGDPECQVLMLRLDEDILPPLLAVAGGGPLPRQVRWKPDHAITVVMAADGYPGTPRKGTPISGLEAAVRPEPTAVVFHAGTAGTPAGLVAAGGRVLNVSATGPDLAAARDTAYRVIDRIDWPGGFCRRDIGWRALALET